MRKSPIALLIVLVLFALPASATPALFKTEAAAHKHCPHDTIVWLNTRTGIYYFKGQLWHGNTVGGAYICEKEADQAGLRPSKNGQ